MAEIDDMTEIEMLWEKGRADKEAKRVNGSLLNQATFICPACGHSKDGPMRCAKCGDPGESNA